MSPNPLCYQSRKTRIDRLRIVIQAFERPEILEIRCLISQVASKMGLEGGRGKRRGTVNFQ
uniref:Uncharacterized protein n=1 Tax=Parascaris equorum TaxID=6256 RepID=A0A914RAM9_PAREQ